MNWVCVILFIVSFTTQQEELKGSIDSDKRVLCFTFLYFDAGDIFDEYIEDKYSLDQHERLTIQKRTSTQVIKCQQLIKYVTNDIQLTAVYNDQQKLIEIVLQLRRIKAQYQTLQYLQQLTKQEESIINDIDNHKIVFQQLRKKKPQMAETQRKAQQESQL